MHRAKLLRLLAGYAARHPREDVAPFRRFVERQPRCFERDCFDDGHVTAEESVMRLAAKALAVAAAGHLLRAR